MKIFLSFVLILVGAAVGSAATLIVPAGGDLQAAWNASACGDVIILSVPAIFTTSADNGFVFPPRLCAGNPIIVKGANYASLPTRVSAADAANMPKILTTGPTPAITFDANSNGWLIQGIEISTVANIDGNHYVNLLVSIGTYVSPEPNSITFDRCWIHSQEDGTDSLDTGVKILVDVEASNVSIIGSRLVTPGPLIKGSQTFDNTAAVMMVHGPGPLTLDNDFLSAWFATFFAGGGSLLTSNTATISAGADMSHMVLSQTANLAAGDLIAVPNQSNIYQVAKVTSVAGTTVNFTPWASNTGAGSPLNFGASLGQYGALEWGQSNVHADPQYVLDQPNDRPEHCCADPKSSGRSALPERVLRD